MSKPLQQGSYIDLKNCTIYLEDGYSKTGAVNNMSGYMIGATTVAVDGLPALTVLPIGARVTFTGDTNEYYIASTVETAGLTTSITLDKPLVAALTDNQVVTFGPNTLEIKVGDGTLTYSETKNREYKLNRGKIDKVRDGDEGPVEVNTTFAWTYIKAYTTDTIPSVEDVLKNRGPAASWVSTGQGCDPYSINLVIKNAPKACVGETHPNETILFPEFRYEKLDHDAKAGTVSMSGKCNATEPTVTRS
jgi:hypothetical protein